MNDEAGFLNALRANPEDIETRLVYADWLEERGDPRHELLRLEVEAERIRKRLLQIRGLASPDWRAAISLTWPRYDAIYDVHCEVVLKSGRLITLNSIEQGRTYSGLLEGTPNRRLNDDDIESDLRRAAQRYSIRGHPACLIPPPRRDYHYEPGDMDRITKERPYWVPEWLPSARCIAAFSSSAIDRSRDISLLTVVWYQDDFAFPISEPALDQIREIPWDSVAIDTDY